MSTAAPTKRLVFDAARLVGEHPPALHHPNKQVVYDVACPDGCRHAGELVYTRWAALPLPDEWHPATSPVPCSTKLLRKKGVSVGHHVPHASGAGWTQHSAVPNM